MGIYDVPAGMLISEVAKDLKAKLKKPAFTEHVKTGAHRERQPNDPDWFYTRAASVLYRVYKEGGTGTGTLRTYYGGRKNRGVKPEEKRKASGKIIRTCLQMLEKEGLLKKEKKGRSVSGKGEKYLFEKAKTAQATFDASVKAKEQKYSEEAAKRVEARAKAEQQRQAAQAQKDAKPQGVAPQKPAAGKEGTPPEHGHGQAKAHEHAKPGHAGKPAQAKPEDKAHDEKKQYAPAG